MKITLSELSTKDLATLVQRTITTSDSGKYTVISGHPLLSQLKISYAEYDAVYTKSTFSGKGNDVAYADQQRDMSFRALKNFLHAYSKISSLAHYTDAEELFGIFILYDLNLDKLSYSSQTAQMKKLIEDLEKPENFQKLNALSLVPAFNEMKLLQNTFEQVFAEQAEINAKLRQMKSASAIRRDLEKILKSFFNFITAMNTLPAWELLYADISELVKVAKNSKKPHRFSNL